MGGKVSKKTEKHYRDHFRHRAGYSDPSQWPYAEASSRVGYHQVHHGHHADNGAVYQAVPSYHRPASPHPGFRDSRRLNEHRKHPRHNRHHTDRSEASSVSIQNQSHNIYLKHRQFPGRHVDHDPERNFRIPKRHQPPLHRRKPSTALVAAYESIPHISKSTPDLSGAGLYGYARAGYEGHANPRLSGSQSYENGLEIYAQASGLPLRYNPSYTSYGSRASLPQWDHQMAPQYPVRCIYLPVPVAVASEPNILAASQSKMCSRCRQDCDSDSGHDSCHSHCHTKRSKGEWRSRHSQSRTPQDYGTVTNKQLRTMIYVQNQSPEMGAGTSEGQDPNGMLRQRNNVLNPSGRYERSKVLENHQRTGYLSPSDRGFPNDRHTGSANTGLNDDSGVGPSTSNNAKHSQGRSNNTSSPHHLHTGWDEPYTAHRTKGRVRWHSDPNIIDNDDASSYRTVIYQENHNHYHKHETHHHDHQHDHHNVSIASNNSVYNINRPKALQVGNGNHMDVYNQEYPQEDYDDNWSES